MVILRSPRPLPLHQRRRRRRLQTQPLLGHDDDIIRVGRAGASGAAGMGEVAVHRLGDAERPGAVDRGQPEPQHRRLPAHASSTLRHQDEGRYCWQVLVRTSTCMYMYVTLR